jgi:leucine-rich repeat protein SHOC2
LKWSFLMLACALGKQKMVNYILSISKINIGLKDENGNNAKKIAKLYKKNISFDEFLVDMITNSKHMKEIYFISKEIIIIPMQINQMTSLESLDLSNNCIQTFPVEFFNLKLKRLNLSHNPIFSFIGFEKFKIIESLFISNVKIKEIPQEIRMMSRLKELDVSSNLISSISFEDIFCLKNVECLNISKNQLISFRGINHLKKLKYLDLSKNHLTALPVDLIDLKYIKEFDLSENKFPESFCKFYDSLDTYTNEIFGLTKELNWNEISEDSKEKVGSGAQGEIWKGTHDQQICGFKFIDIHDDTLEKNLTKDVFL